MAPFDNSGPQVPGIDHAVAKRIRAELGVQSSDRIFRCLRTAAELIGLAEDRAKLRYGESAAYNLREALDAVVRDQSSPDGGLRTALAAWDRYKLSCEQPGADEPAARAILSHALDQLADDRHRQGFMTRRLSEWYRHKTGVAPFDGDGDPAVRYQRLRESSQTALHTDSTPNQTRALYDDVVAWFTQIFRPPSDVAQQLQALAALPYSPERVETLQSLAMNSHHIRLFLRRLADPAWLAPMQQAGLLTLPVAGEPWPVAALTDESHLVARSDVADLLDQFVAQLTSLPKHRRADAAFEVARTCCWLGDAGYPIVAEVVRQFPDLHVIHVLAGAASREMDATNPAQLVIADALIGNEHRSERGYLTRQLVRRLLDGLTPTNVEDRLRVVSFKLRRLMQQEAVLVADTAALTVPGDADLALPVEIASQLARSIPRAAALGLSTSLMISLISEIEGELGERLACQVLASSREVERHVKVQHLAKRLASATATGDDRALIESLRPLADEEMEFLSRAFGNPPAEKLADDAIDRDSARAWRWSMLLPNAVLDNWRHRIESVTKMHGTPDTAALDRRLPSSGWMVGSSPVDKEQLGHLTPLAAAALASRWRPSPEDSWGVSARELARTIQALAEEHPVAWSADPVAIVTAMREPVYVDHYFRALTATAGEVAPQVLSIVAAIRIVTRERWDPTPLGSSDFDYEADWAEVDIAAAELVDSLADAEADFGDALEECWQLALRLASDLPEDRGDSERYADLEPHDDPLHHAINSSHGRGLQAVIALGGWEYRHTGSPSERLRSALTSAVSVQGAIGLQLQSVIAASYPFVEAITGDWIEENHTLLFGDAAGSITFDQALKYSRPTRLLLDLSLDRIATAAGRGSEDAIAWMLIGYLWAAPGYSFDSVYDATSHSELALSEVAQQIARLSADVPADQRRTTELGLSFWEKLIERTLDDRRTAGLAGSGSWALQKEVPDAPWLALTEATLEATDGVIDFAAEVAARCRDLQPEPSALRILLTLLGHGDPWEQLRVEDLGIEALRTAAAAGLSGGSFEDLRERLIQRGRHVAAEIEPPT